MSSRRVRRTRQELVLSEHTRVAPGSHGAAKPGEPRLIAIDGNAQHAAQPVWIDPLLTFMVRRGSTVRVRQRALRRGKPP
jgi:hypothetical protein